MLVSVSILPKKIATLDSLDTKGKQQRSLPPWKPFCKYEWLTYLLWPINREALCYLLFPIVCHHLWLHITKYIVLHSFPFSQYTKLSKLRIWVWNSTVCLVMGLIGLIAMLFVFSNCLPSSLVSYYKIYSSSFFSHLNIAHFFSLTT